MMSFESILNEETIERAAREDWEVVITNLDSDIRGVCKFDSKLVVLYKQMIAGKEDFDMTLLHEFQHIHDDYIWGIENLKGNMYEASVEHRARLVYEHYPERLKFLKELYPQTRRYFNE